MDREQKEKRIMEALEHISELSDIIIDILYGILHG